jgi:hypothetical protein
MLRYFLTGFLYVKKPVSNVANLFTKLIYNALNLFTLVPFFHNNIFEENWQRNFNLIMQLCIAIRNINLVNDKYGKIMNVDTFYKTGSFERRNISIILKDIASL